MKVSNLIQRDIVTCSDRDSANHAAALMWQYDVGCLPVIGEDRRVIGMITDRDIAMAAFLQGRPLQSITVSTVMAKDVVTCAESDSLTDIEHAMQYRQIHRVPVVDADGVLVGIVSINDIARAAYGGRLLSAEVSSTLAAISHPRRTFASAA